LHWACSSSCPWRRPEHETGVERQCASDKCTCSYIASTCRKWNAEHGSDQSRCEGYKQTCMATGEYHDTSRNIAKVVRR
jgi:hypothetical protein